MKITSPEAEAATAQEVHLRIPIFFVPVFISPNNWYPEDVSRLIAASFTPEKLALPKSSRTITSPLFCLSITQVSSSFTYSNVCCESKKASLTRFIHALFTDWEMGPWKKNILSSALLSGRFLQIWVRV